MTIELGLTCEDGLVDLATLASAAAAIDKQIQDDFSPIWGQSARIAPYNSPADIPPGTWPIIVAQNIPDGELGYHQTDQDKTPFARVLFGNSWVLAASHECLEMIADPFGNTTRIGNALYIDGSGQVQRDPARQVQYLQEVCDPCQTADFGYVSNGWAVSSFVMPRYYDGGPSDGVPFSFNRQDGSGPTNFLTAPLDVAAGGYISWLETDDTGNKFIRQLKSQDGVYVVTDPVPVPQGESYRIVSNRIAAGHERRLASMNLQHALLVEAKRSQRLIALEAKARAAIYRRPSTSRHKDVARPKTDLHPWLVLTGVLSALLVLCSLWVYEAANAQGVTRAPYLKWQWIAVACVLVAFCAVAGCVVNKRIDGIFIDERNRISLARLQWVAWIVVIFSSYFTISALNLASGIAPLPKMPTELLELLGIVTGSAVVSNVIVDSKKSVPVGPQPQPSPGEPAQVGLMDRNLTPAEASWADLYCGEEASNRDVVDVSRLQQLVITILLIITYIGQIWLSLEKATISGTLTDMPTIDSSFVTLLGASHAGYLFYKATPKTSVSP